MSALERIALQKVARFEIFSRGSPGRAWLQLPAVQPLPSRNSRALHLRGCALARRISFQFCEDDEGEIVRLHRPAGPAGSCRDRKITVIDETMKWRPGGPVLLSADAQSGPTAMHIRADFFDAAPIANATSFASITCDEICVDRVMHFIQPMHQRATLPLDQRIPQPTCERSKSAQQRTVARCCALCIRCATMDTSGPFESSKKKIFRDSREAAGEGTEGRKVREEEITDVD